MNLTITPVKVYNHSWAELRSYLLAILFVIGNIVLPRLVHIMPGGGSVWLPIYFFTLLGAYKYGIAVGMMTAVASPVVNSALFGMPAAAMLPIIVFKSVVLAASASYIASLRGKISLLAGLVTVVAVYQIAGLGFESLYSSPSVAVTDFIAGWPGMIFQVVACFVLLSKINRK